MDILKSKKQTKAELKAKKKEEKILAKVLKQKRANAEQDSADAQAVLDNLQASMGKYMVPEEKNRANVQIQGEAKEVKMEWKEPEKIVKKVKSKTSETNCEAADKFFKGTLSAKQHSIHETKKAE